LVSVLQQDEPTKQFIRQHDIEFSLTNSLHLLIKNISPVVAEADESNNTETTKEE
jgi:hypothetical protein